MQVVGREDLLGEIEVVAVCDEIEVTLEQGTVLSFGHTHLLGRARAALAAGSERSSRSYFRDSGRTTGHRSGPEAS